MRTVRTATTNCLATVEPAQARRDTSTRHTDGGTNTQYACGTEPKDGEATETPAHLGREPASTAPGCPKSITPGNRASTTMLPGKTWSTASLLNKEHFRVEQAQLACPTRRSPARRWLATEPAQLACGLIACLLLVACGADGSSMDPPQAQGVAGAASAISAFALLRTPPEPMPRPLARHIAGLLKRSDRARPADTQMVQTARGDVWVFLTRRELCLAQSGLGSLSCSPKKAAVKEGVVLGTFKPPSKSVPRLHEFLVLGVVPDGIHRVPVVIGEKPVTHSSAIPVRDNVFAVGGEEPILVGRLHPHPDRQR
jgi:hypothetical protein